MSPTKRSNQDAWLASSQQEDDDAAHHNFSSNNDNDSTAIVVANNGFSMPSPKRLRGGGRGDDDDNNEELYDQEFADMEEEEEDFGASLADNPEDVGSDNAAALLLDHDHVIAASKSKWVRPALDANFDNTSDLNVQWLDIDMFAGAPLTENPNRARDTVVGNRSNKEVPIIRVYGVNDKGHSVTVFIHGFTPYAYFALPSFQNASEDFTLDDAALGQIRNVLEDRLRSGVRRGQETVEHYVLAVQHLNDHKSIMGFETKHTHFLKVHLAMPTLVPTLKRVMAEGVQLPGMMNNSTALQMLEPFECNVPFVLRYMIDQDITGAGWLTLPETTYQIRSEKSKQTHCQVCIKKAQSLAFVRSYRIPVARGGWLFHCF